MLARHHQGFWKFLGHRESQPKPSFATSQHPGSLGVDLSDIVVGMIGTNPSHLFLNIHLCWWFFVANKLHHPLLCMMSFKTCFKHIHFPSPSFLRHTCHVLPIHAWSPWIMKVYHRGPPNNENITMIRWQPFFVGPKSTKTSWWFQPIWKILVKLDHFPKVRGENKQYLSCHHPD